MKPKAQIKRGTFNEIKMMFLNEVTRKQITNLFNEATKSKKVDEHGNWEFGAEFDSKGRGYAINWDLYAYGKDIHNKRLLAVIQIRKWEKQRKNGFASICKSYFLLGRNEDHSTFAHCIESRVIHSAINSGRDVIKACQDWIFQCDYSKVIRQGDLALVPVKKMNGELRAETSILIEDSHMLTADQISVNGSIYAMNPTLIHQPGTHPMVFGTGIYKVMIGIRAKHWNFAAPTID